MNPTTGDTLVAPTEDVPPAEGPRPAAHPGERCAPERQRGLSDSAGQGHGQGAFRHRRTSLGVRRTGDSPNGRPLILAFSPAGEKGRRSLPHPPLPGEGEGWGEGRRVSGRAPPVELAARHLAHWTGLEPGLSAAPGAIRLPLLPSGPDGVHESPPRRAQLFASGPDQRCRDQASGRDSTPHEADFGCRAPLAPRLARPRPSYGPCARAVNTRGTNEGAMNRAYPPSMAVRDFSLCSE